MSDVVLQATCAGLEYFERLERGIGIQDLIFGCKGTFAAYHKVFARLLAVDKHIKSIVFFVENQYIAFGVSTQNMTVYFERAQGLLVVLHVENGTIIGCPNRLSVGVFDFIGQYFTCAEVLDLQRILPTRYCIYPKNSPLIVVAYGKAIKVKVGFTFSHCITIEKNFFRSFERFLVAHINRVILTFFITSLIPITVVAIRHRAIVLFDAAFHFGKERFLQRFGVCCLRLIVGVFGF